MNKIDIPFFNYPALFASHEKEYMAIVHDVLQRGAYIMQKDLFHFETALAHYLGVKHVVGVGDGTIGLLLSLKSAGIRAGDEVILPSHTFVASAAVVHHIGAKPVLADCGTDHLLDSSSVQDLITPRTRAIMPVHLNGRTVNMDPIDVIAKEHDLIIIEDACQALGSTFKRRKAGTFGKTSAFSFYPSKTLGCFGDGGAVVTNDDDVAHKVRMLRDHGRGTDGKVAFFGYNARLDNIQAAVLLFKLKHYDQEIEKRRNLARRYHQKLSGLSQLLLPPPPESDADHFDIFQNYEIEADNRDQLRSFLTKHGVGTITQWGGYAIHQFEKLGLNNVLPYTEKMTGKFMLLPMHTALSLDDVDYICSHILNFYQGK